MMKDLQMKLFAPVSFCTDRRWDLFCNVVVVVLSSRDAAIPDFHYLVNGAWFERMKTIPDYLQEDLDGGTITPMTVSLSSDAIDFHPLILNPVGSPASMDFTFRDDSPLLEEIPSRPCHVVLRPDGSGVAMFVGRAKLTRRYVLEIDEVLRSHKQDWDKRYHELLEAAHAALQPHGGARASWRPGASSGA